MPGFRQYRIGWAGVFLLCVAPMVQAAELLFPEPRHFTRHLENPVAGTVTVIEEYCAGNQVVTIHGERVVIADHARQELIEIDRAAGTYSITPFDVIARANARHQRGADQDVKVEVRVDPAIVLSRNAVEVLIGAAYPNQKRAEHDAILGRTRGVSAESETATHALPVEQLIEDDGITMRNTIVAVGSDRAPQHALLIPPGAKLVESRITRLARELAEIDRLP